jgi:hypothetical protein
MAKKKGRTRQDGERYPSGKLKPVARPNIEPVAPALWDRAKSDLIVKLGDARFGTEVGRLSMRGELSATHAAAAFRLADVYGRFERYKGLRRSTGSPSYMVASSSVADDEAVEAITPEMLARSMAEELLEPEQLADLEERIRRATERFKKLQEFMRTYPRNVVAALELLCIDDVPVNSEMLDNMRAALEELAGFFRIKAAPREERKPERARPSMMTERAITLPDPDREAWLKALRRLRPDLSDPDLIYVYAVTTALKVREAMRRANGKLPATRSGAISEVDRAHHRATATVAKLHGKISAEIRG